MLRQPWSKTVDIILMNEYLVHGNKWTTIGESLKGRNVFAIKNRFFHLMKKLNGNKEKKPKEKKESFQRIPLENQIYPQNNIITQSLESHYSVNASSFIIKRFCFSLIFVNSLNFLSFRSRFK